MMLNSYQKQGCIVDMQIDWFHADADVTWILRYFPIPSGFHRVFRSLVKAGDFHKPVPNVESPMMSRGCVLWCVRHDAYTRQVMQESKMGVPFVEGIAPLVAHFLFHTVERCLHKVTTETTIDRQPPVSIRRPVPFHLVHWAGCAAVVTNSLDHAKLLHEEIVVCLARYNLKLAANSKVLARVRVLLQFLVLFLLFSASLCHIIIITTTTPLPTSPTSPRSHHTLHV